MNKGYTAQLDSRYGRFGISGPHWVLFHYRDDWGEVGLVGFCGHPDFRSEFADDLREVDNWTIGCPNWYTEHQP